MTVWTPGAPTVAGLEWTAARATTDTLNSDGVGYAQVMRSLALETISVVQLDADPLFLGGYGVLDIYVLADAFTAGDTAVTTTRYVPFADGAIVNSANQVGAIVNLFNSVDEDPASFADYITSAGAAAESFYEPYMNCAAWPANQRITDIRIGWALYGTTATSQTFLTELYNGTTTVVADSTQFSSANGIFYKEISLGPDNPYTALPWTQAEIVQLSAAGGLRLGVRCYQTGGAAAAAAFQLGQLYMDIDWVTENRTAVAGGLVTAAGTQTWNNVRDPNTAVANWTKANATDYLLMLRRSYLRVATGATTTYPQTSVSFMQLPGLDSGTVAPMQAYDVSQSYTVQMASGFRPRTLGTVATTRLRAIAPRTIAPAFSEASQPYNELNSKQVYKSTIPPLNQFAEQSLTPSATTAYGKLRCVVRPEATTVNTLEVIITTTAPATLVYTFITAAQALASPNIGTAAEPWYLVEIALPNVVTLTGATQYYVRFYTAVDQAQGNCWRVAFLDTFTGGVGSYGGATDTWRPTGGVDVSADSPIMLVTLPAVPIDFDVTLTTVNLGDGDNCSLDEYQAPTLDWSASVDTLLDYVEIQRLDLLNRDDWETVANLGDGFAAQVLTWTDYEAAQNVESCYRARSVRTDGTASEWTTANATITDAFTRANAALLGNTTTGEAWTAYDSTWGIATNAANVQAGAGSRAAVVSAGAQSAGFVQATIGVHEAGWGLCVGLASSAEYYYVTSTLAGVYSLRQVDAAVDTLIASTAAGKAVAAGTVVKVTWAQGATMALELFVNGVSELNVNSANTPTADQTGAGLWAASTVTVAARWDTFSTTGVAACVTPAFPGCGVIFATNTDPTGIVGYVWPTPSEWQFQDAKRMVLLPLYDRDGQVAFQPTETLGDTFTMNLTLNAVDTPALAGRWVFDDIIALARNVALPYVAVLDENGKRWLCALQCAKGTRKEPGALYIAEVQATTVTFDASVIVA